MVVYKTDTEYGTITKYVNGVPIWCKRVAAKNDVLCFITVKEERTNFGRN